jgi:hypothetical protein
MFASQYRFITGPHIAPFSTVTNPPALYVPMGCSNVALFKPVSCGPSNNATGSPSLLTDGHKECEETNLFTYRNPTRWIQIDLQQTNELHAVAIWHRYLYMDVARCVVVQLCNTPDFTTNVTTLFNNDYDNHNGLGEGEDLEYYETCFGKTIPAHGVGARYVRLYCRGFHDSRYSVYVEVEVWGLSQSTSSVTNRPTEKLILQYPNAPFL